MARRRPPRRVATQVLTIWVLAAVAADAGGQTGGAQTPPPTNRLIEQLHEGRSALGTFTRTTNPELDFVVIDAQDGALDVGTLGRAIDALREDGAARTPAAIVRMPRAATNEPTGVVESLLGLGTQGLMFPDIETSAQAAEAVRSLTEQDPRAPVWPLEPDGHLIALLQIESQTAIDQLDEILDVPGIGAIFLGPYDLAESIGAAGPMSPEVEALVQQVLRACLDHGIPCGYPIVASTRAEAEQQTERRLAEGFRVLAVMTTARD